MQRPCKSRPQPASMRAAPAASERLSNFQPDPTPCFNIEHKVASLSLYVLNAGRWLRFARLTKSHGLVGPVSVAPPGAKKGSPWAALFYPARVTRFSPPSPLPDASGRRRPDPPAAYRQRWLPGSPAPV
ncbi:MAG TPA: hypothetical protein DC012_14600 [Escherichia sp.]|nr:hypothetical protein [Escherichia sp.]